MKDDYIPWADECLEFNNGSYIMGVDLARGDNVCVINGEVQNENSRGNRANLIIYDDMIKPKLYRKLLKMLSW